MQRSFAFLPEKSGKYKIQEIEQDEREVKKMKKSVAVFMGLMMTGAYSMVAFAEQPSAVAFQTPETVVIDGKLDEWKLDSPIEIKDETQVIRDASAWLGETDVSCTVYLMWDETNLYLAADTKEASAFGAVGQLIHDMEDNFKLYISTNPEADPERTTYETNDFLLYLMMDNQNWYTAFDRSMIERENLARFTSAGMEESIDVLTDYEKAYTITEDGFIFEASIPWANFSNDYIELYTPEEGDTISFNFVITDNDYPFPNTQSSVQMSWSGTEDVDTDPSQWGRVSFEK